MVPVTQPPTSKLPSIRTGRNVQAAKKYGNQHVFC